MDGPLPGNTSGIARLMVDAPAFAVGWQELTILPKPAAGAGFTYKAAGGYLTRVLAVHFTLVTSAVVGNRFPAVMLSDNNGALINSVPAGNFVVASSTVDASLHTHGAAYATGANGSVFGFLPDILIPGDWVWSMVNSGGDVADQVSNIALLVQRFPNDAAEVAVNG